MDILRKNRNHNHKKILIGSGRFLLWLLVFVLAWITMMVWYYGVTEVSASIKQILYIILICAPLALIVGAVIQRRYGLESIRDLDQRCNGMNRLEAAVELACLGNPLQQAQYDQTERFYRNAKPYPKNCSLHRLALSLLLACSVTVVVFVVLMDLSLATTINSISPSSNPIGKEMGKKNNKDQEQKKQQQRNQVGMLLILSPESEIRSKPMDVIKWKALAKAPEKFENVQICLYLNAEEKRIVQLGDLNYRKVESGTDDGMLISEFNGEFKLEQLNALPYDLVSYHLSGQTVLNGKKTRILSTPHFIEVRPYREETLEAKLNSLRSRAGGNGKFDRLIDLVGGVHRVMKMQLALNKALFVVRACGLDVEDQNLREQLRLLCRDQNNLKKDIRKICRNAQKEGLPESLIENLQAGVTEMERACIELEKFDEK